MKQYITPAQLNELTDKEKEYLRDWWKPELLDVYYSPTYNGDNPLNEHKVDIGMVNNHASRIRAKAKYNKLIR